MYATIHINVSVYCHPRAWHGNAFRHICLSVSVCVCTVHALTFESLDLETSFLVHKYIFRTPMSRLITKVIGSRSKLYERN